MKLANNDQKSWILGFFLFRLLEVIEKIDCMPAVQAANDWSDVVQNPDIDAVVIGTWPYLHHTIVLAALQANKHVLTEARLVGLLPFCKIPFNLLTSV